MRLVFEHTCNLVDDGKLIREVLFNSIEEAELLHAGKES
jgi:hypothetical protein